MTLINNLDGESQDHFESIRNSYETFIDAESDLEDERIIYQLHYHNWSSHTCPFANSLLQFRRRVRIFMDEFKGEKIGPTIVHCRFEILLLIRV